MIFEGGIRWVLGKVLRLPARQSVQVDVEHGIAVPMRDGASLLADRYYPAGVAQPPLVLIRSPYGRSAMFGIIAGLFAERGFQVLLQSVRGTGGSEGDFDPMRQELDDGVDTLDWLPDQPWFGGRLFTFGLSYLGNVQWAMAQARPEALSGMTLIVTLSNFREELRPSGGLTLGGMLGWAKMMVGMIDAKPGERPARPDPEALKEGANQLPLGTVDEEVIGKVTPFWRAWMEHEDAADDWWAKMDYSAGVTKVSAPTFMVGGWQDIFLPFQIRDFERRQQAGLDAWLTIGPWSHAAPGGLVEGLRQAIRGFVAIIAGAQPLRDRNRVRLYLQGANKWREYPAWPPPGSENLELHLHSDGGLAAHNQAENGALSYSYDPADPTPSLHGPQIIGGAKKRDMAALEARDDTLVFSGQALAHDCDVIGPVSAELSVRSDRDHCDFYVCLCDVDSKGRSLQVCDGYVRLSPGSFAPDSAGIRRIAIDCWPTAYRFKRGHLMRLIVASGAHPRYARNLGTGEPMATAVRMVAANQELQFGQDLPNILRLNVVTDAASS